MIVAALQESRYDTGLDLDLLFEIAEYWEEVRKRSHYKRGVSSLIHMQVYSHQVPGGMMSNLMSQLEVQNASDRLPEVMTRDPARARRGRLPAARHAHVPDRGHAGRVQRAYRQALGRRVQGDEGLHLRLLRQGTGPHRPRDREEGRGQFSRCCPTTWLRQAWSPPPTTRSSKRWAIWLKREEDVLMYALFPNEARTLLEQAPRIRESRLPHAGGVQQYRRRTITWISTRFANWFALPRRAASARSWSRTAVTRIAVRMPGAMPGSCDRLPPRLRVAAAPAAARSSARRSCRRCRRARAVPPTGMPSRPPWSARSTQLPPRASPRSSRWATRLTANQTLCIVEAMKLMNEITAEEIGTVREVCVKDADPVEFGSRAVLHRAHGDQPKIPERVPCSRRSSSQTAARLPCASCAPARSWA